MADSSSSAVFQALLAQATSGQELAKALPLNMLGLAPHAFLYSLKSMINDEQAAPPARMGSLKNTHTQRSYTLGSKLQRVLRQRGD